MADVFEPKVRSYIMSKIRKTDTKPELAVRKHLFNRGFRYRLYDKGLPGSPDIVLPKYKTVIFVNGCFWHAHKGCKHNKPPKTNQDYWIPKIERTVERDKRNQKEISELGWKVIIVWECEIEKPNFDNTMNELIKEILENEIY